MQVSKWGNSLALRIPATVVEALGLKEGDDLEITVTGPREISVARDQRRAAAVERLRKRAKPLPAGWKFDRLEANAR